MREALANLLGDGVATALMWIVAALILLLVILVILRLSRGRDSGTFVVGGRNRAPRLAVVDAAAIDNQRRLVLVRRDDVEHLILIGGAGDIIVEQDIRATQPAHLQPARREPSPVQPPPPAPRRPSDAPQAISRPRPQQAQSRPEPVMARPERPPAPERPYQPVVAPPSAAAVPPRQPAEALRREPPLQHRTPQAARAPSSPERTADYRNEQDEEPTLEDIDISIDELRHSPRTDDAPPTRQEPTLEDEMSRLLDELSEDKPKES